MTRTYRPGALGAMMDEYERAAVELTNLLETVDAPSSLWQNTSW